MLNKANRLSVKECPWALEHHHRANHQSRLWKKITKTSWLYGELWFTMKKNLMTPLNQPQRDDCESIWSVAKVLLAFFNRYSLSAFVFVRPRQKLGAPSIVRSIYSNPPEPYRDPLSSESLQLWSAARFRQTGMGKVLPIPFITDMSHNFYVNTGKRSVSSQDEIESKWAISLASKYTENYIEIKCLDSHISGFSKSSYVSHHRLIL